MFFLFQACSVGVDPAGCKGWIWHGRVLWAGVYVGRMLGKASLLLPCFGRRGQIRLVHLLWVDQVGCGKSMDLEVKENPWTIPLSKIWEFWVLCGVVGSYAEGTCGFQVRQVLG